MISSDLRKTNILGVFFGIFCFFAILPTVSLEDQYQHKTYNMTFARLQSIDSMSCTLLWNVNGKTTL